MELLLVVEAGSIELSFLLLSFSSCSVGSVASTLPLPLSPTISRPLVSYEVVCRASLYCCAGCTLHNFKGIKYNLNRVLS